MLKSLTIFCFFEYFRIFVSKFKDYYERKRIYFKI